MKLAVCFGRDGIDHRAIALRMAEAECFPRLQTHGVSTVGSGSIGYVSGSDRFSRVPMKRESESGNVLIVTGVPIHPDCRLDATLEQIVSGDYRRAAGLLSGLDGAFAAAFWDNTDRKLLVVNDFLGAQPTYYLRRDGVFVLSSEIRAIAASGLVNVAMNPAAWGSFMSLGLALGEGTQMAGVARMTGATVLIYDPVEDALASSKHWRHPDGDPGMDVDDVDTGRLVDLIARDARAYGEHVPRATLLLSGGFDSRLILSVLRREKIDFDVLIVENEGHYFGADSLFARKVAERLVEGTVTTVRPPLDFNNTKAYLEYLIMNEAATPSLSLFIPRVAAAVHPGMEAVWDGLFPGHSLTAGYEEAAGGFDGFLKKTRLLDRRGLWPAAPVVFSRSMNDDMYEGLRTQVETERRCCPDDGFAARRFLWRNRMVARISPNPMKVFANRALPFTPACSHEYWDIVSRIPFDVRAHHRLYRKIYQRHFPEAARTPFCDEKGTYSLRRLAPGIRLRNAAYLTAYYCRRVKRLPAVEGVLRRLRRPGGAGNGKSLMLRILAAVDPGHPELNADGVRAILSAPPGCDGATQLARKLLFYWQAWRLIMTGRLSPSNMETFMGQDARPVG